jgi:hemolysin activation/secretion protein
MLLAYFSNKKVVKSTFLLACLLGISSAGWSATVLPDAADIPRPQPTPPVPPKPAKIPQPEAPQPAVGDEASISVVVNRFVFTGNKAFDAEQLSPLVADFVGKEASLSTLQLASKRITDFYRKHGYLLAVAYLPAQDIQQNTVEIAVLEGSLGALKLNVPATLSETFLSQMAQYQLEPEGAITERNLVRNVTQLNALPGLVASAQLNPGVNTGSSDVEITLEPVPAVQGYVAINTYGNRFTGRETLLTGLAINNLAGVGDQLFLSLRNSNNDGQRGINLGYVTPIHSSGTLLTASINYVDYQLGGPFKQLKASGDSQFFNIGIDQPLFRDAQAGLSLHIGATHKRVDDEIAEFSFNNQRHITNVDLGLMVDWFNAAGDVSYELGVYTRAGTLSFKDAFAESLDAASTRTEGHFIKHNITANRAQFFGNGVQWALRADYQYSNRNLDSVEKLMIGGINRWRAFAELPSQADTGLMLGTELRKNWQAGPVLSKLMLEGLGLYGFLDYGRGRLNRNALSEDNHVRSTTVGLGTDVAFIKKWMLGLTWSHQARKFDGLSSENETRVWGQLQKDF